MRFFDGRLYPFRVFIQKLVDENAVIRRKFQRRLWLISLGSFQNGKCTLMYRNGGEFTNG